MKERLIRSMGGLAACALVLMLVAGPATTAFADGGPDRVLGTQAASGQRPGFGDHIMPARPGFGDRIRPPARSGGSASASSATTVDRDGGWSTTTTVALVGGVVLAVGALTLVLTAVRKRHRLAPA